jgi:hypothetical protein
VSRLLSVCGSVATALAVVVIAALHVTPPSSYVDPVRRTISQYAHESNGWVFNLGVLLLVAGSVAIQAALIRAKVLAPGSAGSVAFALWSLSLAAVVYWPKHNWQATGPGRLAELAGRTASEGPSASGDIHRAASLVAFLSLPAAAVLIASLWLTHERWRRHARATLVLGILSVLAFTPIVYAFVAEPFTGVRWWRAIPLGAVERALVLGEVAAVLSLGLWATRASAKS